MMNIQAKSLLNDFLPLDYTGTTEDFIRNNPELEIFEESISDSE
jgi:hypothetical protein